MVVSIFTAHVSSELLPLGILYNDILTFLSRLRGYPLGEMVPRPGEGLCLQPPGQLQEGRGLPAGQVSDSVAYLCKKD
jgi:hypothetical protein